MSNDKDKDREFPNPFADYNADQPEEMYLPEEKKLIPALEGLIKENIMKLLETLELHISNDNSDSSDTSVYTGTSGIALLYLHFLNNMPIEGRDFLKDALAMVEPVLPNLKKKKFSFLCGVAGPLAITSALYHRKEMPREASDLARRLENLERDVCSFQSSDVPDELLYGRTGYLHGLLFLRKHLEETDQFRDNAIKEVVNAILESGKRNAKKFKNTMKVPLYFEWHDKAYIGAAHGFAGILYMLLEAKQFLSEDQLEHLVRPTVEYVLGLQLPSGNFPSSLGNPRDRLVHWCHGAPGVIHLLLLAYETFKEDKYLEASRLASDCIWQRGLLKKGYGICHGVSGNGYAQLRMFQVTKEIKYLHRALKFAEWCFDYGKHGCRTPDRPMSLFEGCAGVMYFLLDLLNPEKASFPAFQI